ncbi:MAG: MBL fold metallo-hydrolase [Chloroflexi bacterium]|nr:MAG: MBL fold metallo-hydrolase [Chloroflexota bacterium]
MTDIRDRIHAFAIPTPFPVGPVNVYLIEGDPLTLVDTGPRIDAAREALHAGLSELGYTLRDIEQVVVTHSHLDHIGQLQHVTSACDAPVLSHHRNVHWLVDFEVEWVRRLTFYGMYLYQAGLPEEQVATVRELMSGGIRLGASIPEERFRPLRHGDRIQAGGVEWTVYHMPGHASGHLVLYQPEAGIILAGDLLLAEVSSNPVLESPARGESERPRSLTAYLDSLQRLAELDAARILTGHGPPITDHRRLIAERLTMHRRRLDRIAGFLAEGRRSAHDRASPAGRTPFEVCRAVFPNLAERDIFLGMSEVIGHLDVLEDEGRIVAEKHGGLLFYRPRTGD